MGPKVKVTPKKKPTPVARVPRGPTIPDDFGKFSN